MNLFFIRHGIAVEPSEFKGTDEERHLTKEGIEKFEKSCAGLKKIIESPTHIYCSPYLRTRETAEILGKSFPKIPVEVKVELALDYPTDQALEWIRSFNDNKNFVFVGHQPCISQYLCHLLLPHHKMFDESPFRLKKGGLAWVEREGQLYQLMLFLGPKQLKEIGQSKG